MLLCLKFTGASLARWLTHLPFTFKIARSVLSEKFLEPSLHVKRVKVNALPKVVGFLRVSSHMESWQGGLG
jgi:hypothetical protein